MDVVLFLFLFLHWMEYGCMLYLKWLKRRYVKKRECVLFINEVGKRGRRCVCFVVGCYYYLTRWLWSLFIHLLYFFSSFLLFYLLFFTIILLLWSWLSRILAKKQKNTKKDFINCGCTYLLLLIFHFFFHYYY